MRFIHTFTLLLFSILSAAQPLLLNDEFTQYRPHWRHWSGAQPILDEGMLNLAWDNNLEPGFLRLEQYLSPRQNFVLETEITAQNSSLGAAFGLTWGGKQRQEEGMSFLLRPEGYYAVLQRRNGQEQYLINWTKSSRIKKVGKANELRVIRRNWAYYFEINGKEVQRIDFKPWNGFFHGIEVQGVMGVSVGYFRIFHPEIEIPLVADMFLEGLLFPLDTPLNQPNTHETEPLLSPDGRHFYFTRTAAEPASNGQLLHSFFRGDTAWTEPAPIYRSGPGLEHAALYRWEEEQAILAERQQSGASTGRSLKLRAGRLAEDAENWDGPELPAQKEAVSYCFLPKEQLLIFSAELPGGKGGQDLWLAHKNVDGTWAKPENLGPEINTFGRESHPYYEASTQRLYFSSDGFPGYGGLDLYRITRSGDWDQWSDLGNLGPKINGPGDDLSLWPHPNRSRRYFVVGQLTYGDDYDIYRLRIPRSLTEQGLARINGVVRDQTTGKILKDAQVRLARLEADTLGPYREVATDSGHYEAMVSFGYSYQLAPSHPGYFPKSDTVNLRPVRAYRSLQRNLYLIPVTEGTTINLERVFFVRAKAELRPDSYPELENLLLLMQRTPSLQIEVRGHTDNIGEEAQLQALSEARAATVRQFLIDHGISSERIQSKGFGPTRPIADNRNPETRKLNRRVEFRVISL